MDPNVTDLLINELIKQNSVAEQTKKDINHFVKQLEHCLRLISPIKGRKLHDIKWLTDLNVKYPITDQPEPKSTESAFEFYPPDTFNLIGDFSLDCSTRFQPISTELAVQIPDKIVSGRDYLNQTYHRKRALFLCVLIHNLCKFPHLKLAEFFADRNEPLKPYLRLYPAGQFENKFVVIIKPYVSQNFWKLERCGLSVSNLRLPWYFDLPQTEGDQNDHFPTPIYNHTILYDMLLTKFTEEISGIFSQNDHYRHASILIHVWLRSRCLDDVIRPLFIHCFLCYMHQNRRISTSSSSFHVFRTFLLVLSQTCWDKKGASLKGENFDVAEFHKHFSVVFVDFSGFFNICYDWTVLTYYRLKNECSLSLHVMDSADSDTFASIFIEPVPFYRKFDQYFTIDFNEPDSFIECPKHTLADYSGRKNPLIVRKVIDLLQKAIGSRILLMEFEKPRSISWSTDEHPAPERSICKFGLLLNSDTYANLMDKGPAADSPAAFEFRAFWGEKSEMRKFADTSICEAVVWEAEGSKNNRSVIEQIVKYILHRHMRIASDKIKFYGQQILQVLKLPNTKGICDDEFAQIVKAYDEFAQILRLLENLPLRINRIFSCSALLRRTEVCPPLTPTLAVEKSKHYVRGKWIVPRPGALHSPSWCSSMDVQITLESSGKWPDDINAIRKLKTAFYMQISRLLEKQFPEIFSTVLEDSVLVYYKNYVFRLIIVYQREIHVLKTSLTKNGVAETKNSEEAAILERNLIDRPKLCGYLHSLTQKYPSYCSTCRCVKIWISCHMLGDYLTDELIELLVAYVFISPHPYSTPGSCYAAFLRVLALLSDFDWLISPLIVNLNNEIDKEKLREITAQFVSLRPALPPMCVVTPDDHSGVKWTRPYPNAVIVERLTQLARSSLNYIENNVFGESLFDIMVIFRTPLDPYNVLIWLNVRHVPKRHMSLDQSRNILIDGDDDQHVKATAKRRRNKKAPKRLLNESAKHMPVVDYDPVECFLKDLKEKYDKILMPFYDKYGGNVIALLFKPGSKKITLSDSDKKESFLKSIEKMGKGLIRHIEFNNNNKRNC